MLVADVMIKENLAIISPLAPVRDALMLAWPEWVYFHAR